MLDLCLKEIPRYPLTCSPSPIQPLRRLSRYLNNQVDLYVKREDMNSLLGLGGSTMRKMEYIVPEILSGGYDTLVSVGGIQSNQTRQIAAIAAHLGLRCILVQHPSWVDITDPLYEQVGNIQLSRLMGAKIVIGKIVEGKPQPSLKEIAQQVIQDGGKPFIIPAGCAKLPLGSIGFVDLAQEIQAQENSLGFQFDAIVVCTSTGSTQAGLMVGFSPSQRAQQVIGIDTSFKPEKTQQQILNMIQKTEKLLAIDSQFQLTDIQLKSGYAGHSYGIPDQKTRNTIALCAQLEALIVDPIYEAKAMTGLIDLVQQHYFAKNNRLLYIHLGGTPSINAYRDL
jgi:1-aminocyclopropane-1-carboxylate deaminase